MFKGKHNKKLIVSNEVKSCKRYPVIFSNIIPYKYIKEYRIIKIDFTGSITLISPIANVEHSKNAFNKVFFNDKEEIVFIESYLDDTQLDYELIVENGKLQKKLLFNKNGNENFCILYKYKDARIVEEKAIDTSENIIYAVYIDKNGRISKMDIYKA